MLLKKLFNSIKNSFFKKQPKELTEDEKRYDDFVNNILPSLKFGDIIYAERYNNEWEKETMPKGHETGPYIVIGFEDDKVIGCYCTSTENRKNHFEIGEAYKLFNRTKKTYTNIRNIKTIDYISYINKNEYSLNNYDKLKLIKSLKFNDNINFNDFGLIKKLVINNVARLEPKDVIFYNNNYYLIIREKNDVFVCIPIQSYNKHHSYLNFSEITIDYKAITEIPKNIRRYINTIPDIQFEIIKKKYEENNRMYEHTLKVIEQQLLVRGCLIENNNKLYYVYGVEGVFANAFLVEKSSDKEDIITIAKEVFLPFFDKPKDVNINNDSYRVLAVASEDEMDNIRSEKKKWSKSNKDNKVIDAKKVFTPKPKTIIGDIICYKKDITQKYLIVDLDEHNNITVISINSLISKNELVYLTFKKDKNFKKCTNITTIELNIIKRNLQNLQVDEELQKILVQKYQ